MGSHQPAPSALPSSEVWHFRWCGVASCAVRSVGFPKAFPPVRASLHETCFQHWYLGLCFSTFTKTCWSLSEKLRKTSVFRLQQSGLSKHCHLHITHSEPVVGYGFSSFFARAWAERVEVPRWTLAHLLKITCLDSDLGLKVIPAIIGFELTVYKTWCRNHCFHGKMLHLLSNAPLHTELAFHVQVLFKQVEVVLEVKARENLLPHLWASGKWDSTWDSFSDARCSLKCVSYYHESSEYFFCILREKWRNPCGLLWPFTIGIECHSSPVAGASF